MSVWFPTMNGDAYFSSLGINSRNGTRNARASFSIFKIEMLRLPRSTLLT